MIALKAPEVIDVNRLLRALRHSNGETLANVLDDINNGTTVLLRAQESTLTIMLEPSGLHINQMAGKLSDIGEIKDCLVLLAQQHGKQYITLEGRPGWQRVLKAWGFYPRGKRMALEVRL